MITDEMRLDFIEDQVRKSRSGVSFDRIPSVEGEPKGFRFMRLHDIHNPHGTLRIAIDQAMRKIKGDDWYQKELD